MALARRQDRNTLLRSTLYDDGGAIAQFDIFTGEPGRGNAAWVEAAASQEAANDRLEVLASEKLGKYFVFCTTTRAILSVADTSPRAHKK
jgi:hypothetical protein